MNVPNEAEGRVRHLRVLGCFRVWPITCTVGIELDGFLSICVGWNSLLHDLTGRCQRGLVPELQSVEKATFPFFSHSLIAELTVLSNHEFDRDEISSRTGTIIEVHDALHVIDLT